MRQDKMGIAQEVVGHSGSRFASDTAGGFRRGNGEIEILVSYPFVKLIARIVVHPALHDELRHGGVGRKVACCDGNSATGRRTGKEEAAFGVGHVLVEHSRTIAQRPLLGSKSRDVLGSGDASGRQVEVDEAGDGGVSNRLHRGGVGLRKGLGELCLRKVHFIGRSRKGDKTEIASVEHRAKPFVHVVDLQFHEFFEVVLQLLTERLDGALQQEVFLEKLEKVVGRAETFFRFQQRLDAVVDFFAHSVKFSFAKSTLSQIFADGQHLTQGIVLFSVERHNIPRHLTLQAHQGRKAHRGGDEVFATIVAQCCKTTWRQAVEDLCEEGVVLDMGDACAVALIETLIDA